MSAHEIDINALTDAAVEAANDLLINAAECVTALLEVLPADQVETMGKRSMLVVVHAILQHLDCRAEERQQQQAAMIEALHDLRESIDFLAARSDDETTLALTVEESEIIVAALKAAWLKGHLVHSEKEYIEAVNRFEKMAGL